MNVKNKITMIKFLVALTVCVVAYLGISTLLVRYGIIASVNDEEYAWSV